MISGGGTQCSPCGLWHTTDGGLTFTKLANVDFAAAIGFGNHDARRIAGGGSDDDGGTAAQRPAQPGD